MTVNDGGVVFHAIEVCVVVRDKRKMGNEGGKKIVFI